MRRAAVPAILAVALAGCGGGGSPSTEEFETSVVETRDRVDRALAHIQEATSEEDFLDRLDEAAAVIDDAATDFEDEGAPTRFEDESDRLVVNLHDLAAALHGTAGEARELGFDKLLTGARGLNFESWDRVNADLREFRRQGIQVRPLERH